LYFVWSAGALVAIDQKPKKKKRIHMRLVLSFRGFSVKWPGDPDPDPKNRNPKAATKIKPTSDST